MATTLSVLKKKQNKYGILARHILEATDPKISMNTQLDSGSNMGLVIPGHTSTSVCVRLKIVYQYVCMFVCIHFITKAAYQIGHISGLTPPTPFMHSTGSCLCQAIPMNERQYERIILLLETFELRHYRLAMYSTKVTWQTQHTHT